MDEITEIGFHLVNRLEASIGDRVYKAIALKIRTKVLDARNGPDIAGRRWPFELIQNAHDAGARAGRDGISLFFSLEEGVLRFEHDAAPFTMDEFAALLTGGSSKDFMSTETTGRFGTGFLVTHVLSERVQVSGILAVDEQHRAFKVDLYRPNDEAILLENVKDSQSSLLHTRLVEDLDDEPTAAFEYVVDEEKIALAGLETLEQSLPHLFSTCRKLREITIHVDGQETVWRKPQGPRIFSAEGVRLIELNIEREEDGERSDWRLIRASLNLAVSTPNSTPHSQRYCRGIPTRRLPTSPRRGILLSFRGNGRHRLLLRTAISRSFWRRPGSLSRRPASASARRRYASRRARTTG